MIPTILNKMSLKMQNRTFYCENINQYKLQKKSKQTIHVTRLHKLVELIMEHNEVT